MTDREDVYKRQVEGELLNYGVDDALIKDFLDALNNCEFARFAPGDDIRLWIKFIQILWKLSVKWKTL